jgi:UDP-glucuronate decarboxylase
LQRCPDIALAESALGWKPMVDLGTGLRQTADYFSRMLAEAEGQASHSVEV